MDMNLADIKSRIEALAKIIAAPQNVLPTYGYSEQSGRPHIEVDSSGYHYFVAERSLEFERHTSKDMDEILYDVFQGVTFELACAYELHHRIEGQDFRKILFAHQEALMMQLSPGWCDRKKLEHAEVLEQHPFVDEA